MARYAATVDTRWIAACLLLACDSKHPAPPDARPVAQPETIVEAKPTDVVVPPCPVFDAPVEIAKLSDRSITEASGIVASRKQPGMFWVHNDSGDGPRVYAIDEYGATRGTFYFEGASAFDWEDIAIGRGPEPGRDYLYVGDIGDNIQFRDFVTVYRIAEPQITAVPDPSVDIPVTDVVAFQLSYPDAPHNAEALLIDPITGDLLLFTKAKTRSDVMRAAAPLKPEMMLEPIVALDDELGSGDRHITAGDLSPDGRFIAVRLVDHALLWRRVDDEPITAAVFARPACALPLPRRGGGEAIGWRPDDGGYMLVNEGPRSPLWRAKPAR